MLKFNDKMGSVKDIKDFYKKCVVFAIMSNNNRLHYSNIPKKIKKDIMKDIDVEKTCINIDKIIRDNWINLVKRMSSCFDNSGLIDDEIYLDVEAFLRGEIKRRGYNGSTD